MDGVPVALACGHLVSGAAHYLIPAVGSDETATVLCPEGCGWQTFVVEPHDGGFRCLCQPGRHVCGDVSTLSADLGELELGDEVEIDYGFED